MVSKKRKGTSKKKSKKDSSSKKNNGKKRKNLKPRNKVQPSRLNALDTMGFWLSKQKRKTQQRASSSRAAPNTMEEWLKNQTPIAVVEELAEVQLPVGTTEQWLQSQVSSSEERAEGALTESDEERAPTQGQESDSPE